jgi:transposase
MSRTRTGADPSYRISLRLRDLEDGARQGQRPLVRDILRVLRGADGEEKRFYEEVYGGTTALAERVAEILCTGFRPDGREFQTPQGAARLAYSELAVLPGCRSAYREMLQVMPKLVDAVLAYLFFYEELDDSKAYRVFQDMVKQRVPGRFPPECYGWWYVEHMSTEFQVIRIRQEAACLRTRWAMLRTLTCLHAQDSTTTCMTELERRTLLAHPLSHGHVWLRDLSSLARGYAEMSTHGAGVSFMAMHEITEDHPSYGDLDDLTGRLATVEHRLKNLLHETFVFSTGYGGICRYGLRYLADIRRREPGEPVYEDPVDMSAD